MSTRAWVVATALSLGMAFGADAQVADRMGKSRTSSGSTARTTQQSRGTARGQAQGRTSSTQGRTTQSRAQTQTRTTQSRAQTQTRTTPSRAQTQTRTTPSRAQTQTRTTPSQTQTRTAQGRASGTTQSRTQPSRTPPPNTRTMPPNTRSTPPPAQSGGTASGRIGDRTAQPRTSGTAGRAGTGQSRVNEPDRNRATRSIPGVGSGQTNRNQATRVIPGTANGRGNGGPPGRIEPRPSDRNRTPPRGVVRGYATGAGWDRGWDWDRNRNRNWYVNRDRDWYRYWERDRLWNWRGGPIPGWWIGFRFAPRGVSFAWHVNLFWNSWDAHYGWSQNHAWLHEQLDRIHEEWHLRYGWRGYTEGWYRAHEALHDRLEYEHDQWYRRGAYAWPWNGPEVWLQWGIPDPYEFDTGYYDSDYHGSLDWR